MGSGLGPAGPTHPERPALGEGSAAHSLCAEPHPLPSTPALAPTVPGPRPAAPRAAGGAIHKLTSVFFSKPTKSSSCQRDVASTWAGLGVGARRRSSLCVLHGEMAKPRIPVPAWDRKVGSSLRGGKEAWLCKQWTDHPPNPCIISPKEWDNFESKPPTCHCALGTYVRGVRGSREEPGHHQQ